MHGILTFRFYWMLENYWRRVERVGEKLSKQFLFNCKLLLKCSRSKEKMRIHFFPSLWVHVNCENAYKWKPSRCELIHFLSEIEKRADIASIIPFIVFFSGFFFLFWIEIIDNSFIIKQSVDLLSPIAILRRVQYIRERPREKAMISICSLWEFYSCRMHNFYYCYYVLAKNWRFRSKKSQKLTDVIGLNWFGSSVGFHRPFFALFQTSDSFEL